MNCKCVKFVEMSTFSTHETVDNIRNRYDLLKTVVQSDTNSVKCVCTPCQQNT